jgi:hypothetical protein
MNPRIIKTAKCKTTATCIKITKNCEMHCRENFKFLKFRLEAEYRAQLERYTAGLVRPPYLPYHLVTISTTSFFQCEKFPIYRWVFLTLMGLTTCRLICVTADFVLILDDDKLALTFFSTNVPVAKAGRILFKFTL